MCGPEDNKMADFPELDSPVLFGLGVLMFWEFTFGAMKVSTGHPKSEIGVQTLPVLFGNFLTVTLGVSPNSCSLA